MRATRHNGRAGKNGAYNPKHNDRDYNLSNSDHIDAERTGGNIYWDYIQGSFSSQSNFNERVLTFSEVEKIFYLENYGDSVDSQNERNEMNCLRLF